MSTNCSTPPDQPDQELVERMIEVDFVITVDEAPPIDDRERHLLGSFLPILPA